LKVLLIEKSADGLLDLAIRAKANGHEVRYCLSSYHQHNNPIGRGLVEREHDYLAGIRWADLVIVGGNDYRQAELDRWRQQGKLIVGSSVECESWESDRSRGMAVFRACGIPVPPYREFTDYDSAIQYVKRHDEPFVSKPSGKCDDKAMSYVAKSPEDLVYMLERWKRAGKRTGEAFILQEKIDGVEFAVGAWFGPAGFVPEWEENWEHKKLMSGNLGPNCYSADTEVLTETGWKFWPDVVASDKIATLVDGALTYERPSQLVAAPFRGEMISWQSNRIDMLVTPGHQMYVADRDTIRRGEPEFFHLPAETVARSTPEKKFAVLRTAGWSLTEPWGERDHPSPQFARLLGMFLADGYCRKGSVQFGNCPPHKEEVIRAAALDCGYTAHRYGRDIYINSTALVDLFKIYPKAVDKRIPPEIMAAPPAVIRAFLDGLSLDATRSGHLIYTTASRGMADDIQIALLKIGMAGIVRERDRRGDPDRLLAGHLIKGTISWDVSVSSNALAWLRPQYCRRVAYDGTVYCATVSSHVLFVRRNGKACWNGQTGEMGTVSRWVTKSKLADLVLKPLETMLHRAGFVGCIDISVMVDEEGTPWPLEATSRCGWPAMNLECSAFDCDMVEFFHGLATGRPPKRVHRLDEIVCGIVLALPDFPYSHATRKEVIGVPIYGLSPKLMSHVHFAQAMLGEAPQGRGGGIKTAPMCVSAGDYVAIVTGQGATVNAARRQAYGHINQLSMPSGAFWRNDIGQRLTKDVPQLQRHGFAMGIEI
jgi:phosphoribosylamine-glycine ligase